MSSTRRRGLGDALTVVDHAGSTMDLAAAAVADGAPEGWLVVAGTQTAGRGRRGHQWWSPPGAGLYCSLVLRPPDVPRKGEAVAPAALLTLAAGVAVADGIAAATGVQPALKWPNDVFCGRKVAGVLAEGHGAGTASAAVVLGIGINLREGALPPEAATTATSLEAATGRSVTPGPVLSEVLVALATHYAHLCDGHVAHVLDAWRARATPFMGRTVRWDASGVSRAGQVDGLADDGALLVRTTEGIARIIAGEVRWA